MDAMGLRQAVLGVACMAAACVAAPGAPEHKVVKRFAVNEYFSIPYEREPVSFDVTFDEPVAKRSIGLLCGGKPVVSQVEVLAGTPAAVKQARVWTHVSFPFVEREVEQQQSGKTVKVKKLLPGTPEQRHRIFSVVVGAGAVEARSPVRAERFGRIGGVEVATVSNDLFHARIPVGSVRFDAPVSAFDLPGPVVSVSRDGKEWIGSGYLAGTLRVEAVTCRVDHGPVYFESAVTYAFEGGKRYVSRVRVYPGKPYARLVEDFDVGGASKYVFSYDDWFADALLYPGDGDPVRWKPITMPNPAQDFVRIKGQEALARLVVWSQHNYFRGKQETLALKAPDVRALDAAHEEALRRYAEQVRRNDEARERHAQQMARHAEELKRYKQQLDAHEKDPKKVRKPAEPRPPRPFQPRVPREPVKPVYEEVVHTVAGAPIRAASVATPGGDTTAVGAFFVRPDRWTRAKVNHVDLYMRPEVPGERTTRGAVGLEAARLRIAMEAWLVDGHREWAIFAARSGDEAWLAKAHVREGVWPLDRIIRLPLVWNADGSPVRLEDTKPCDGLGFAGDIATVLHSTHGRCGLMHFNGSNSSMRGGYAGQARRVRVWAEANRDKRTAAKCQELGLLGQYMVGPAMAAYMAMDDSAYPGRRAMLPWSDPEALNPFYQGMENMNFNVDRYSSVFALGLALEAMGHPQAGAFVGHALEQFNMGLDRYVYPRSGCWEESHGYAGCILRIGREMGREFRGRGLADFFADRRLMAAFRFWTQVLSPPDPGFGDMRVIPPVGDHGLSLAGMAQRIAQAVPDFAATDNPESKRLARQLVWSLRQRRAEPPDGDVQAEEPDLRSRWLQGYGTVMRARWKDKGRPLESFVVLRAGQSWGHHHCDKGSMWFWGRNVHFFGDCAWSGPPGGTYWNKYKQGPASGTQIELLDINNWTLPCKYPAPWISDEEYADGCDYANARCLYPFNPPLDLGRSTAVALRNGYDRQVLFVHPELLIVRDNVETNCRAVWRMHAYQVDGLKVAGNRATMPSPHKVTGELAILHPRDGVRLHVIDRDDLNDHVHKDADGKPLPYEKRPKFGLAKGEPDYRGRPSAVDTRSVVLRYDMPESTNVTWVFGVHGAGEPAPAAEVLDGEGRVTRVKLPDGREVIALLNIEPFRWSGQGVEFAGTVGLVVRDGGKAKAYPIRAETLRVK